MRRRLLTITIFILAGAVVNVAVAWLCAWASKPYLSTMHSHPAWTTKRVVGHDEWTLYTQSRTGIVRAMARRPYTECAATTVPLDTFPSWCSIHQLPAIQRPSWNAEGVVAGLSDCLCTTYCIISKNI